MNKNDEIVLVVKRSELFEGESLLFQGHTSENDLVSKIMNNIDKGYESMRRGGIDEVDTILSRNAELNLGYKQPIPSVVIRKGDELFVTERLEGGGESRLHGKLSLTIGGHMNPIGSIDTPFSEVLVENTMRELEEELEITGDIKVTTIGLINDDSDDVGRVHLGILGIIDLDSDDEVKVRETEQLAGKWLTLEQLREEDVYSKLENWGKIVVDMM